nr:hypothetical protein [Tanacetum cinerariifolium]
MFGRRCICLCDIEIATRHLCLRGKSLDISYFYVFGFPVNIHNHMDYLGKFDEKVDDGFFLGYSLVAKAFRVFNIRRQEMEEIVHVTYSEDDEAISQSSIEDEEIHLSPVPKIDGQEKSILNLLTSLENLWLEGFDYEETFTSVARLKAIKIFLAYVAYIGFKVYQMDVKSVFLDGKISEDVYVQQSPGFESSEFPDHVCKLDKALYGLKQAHRECSKEVPSFDGLKPQPLLNSPSLGIVIEGSGLEDGDAPDGLEGVISTTSVSRPQLKSNSHGDRVMHNNSQGKKKEVEDHRRSVKLSKNKTSVTACNDSLNAKTLNVKSVSAMCDKCVLHDKHGICVLKSVDKPFKETVASESNKKPRNLTKKLYEHVSKTCSWWYPKFTPSGYIWKPKSKKENVNPILIEIVLFIVDSGCSKHMTGNLKLLINFVEKFLGTVKFRNDQIAPILGYGDLVQGIVMIKRVYYVEGLNHNLFSVGQFCDADLEVAFRKSTCFIRDLKGNDLLTGSHGTDLYSITLQDSNFPNLICLMAKATSSQAWLWHRRLSHLNFDTINLLSKNDIVVGLPKLKFIKDHLCSSCELGKAKRKYFHTKLTPSSKRRLQLLHMNLCGPMRLASINGKRYVLVIVDDYSRYTWTRFLMSKDETPEVLIDFLRLVQRGLQAQVRVVRTDKGTKFLNQTLHAYFAAEGIHHQTSVARTPKQNGVVKRRNRTLVEATRTMLSVAKVPLFFWAEAIATTCFTQNRSLVIPRHEKTPYHIINDRKPSVKFFHIFGLVCYIVRDGENLDKIKEKGDICIFVGYSTQSKAYRVFNKRTRVIMESIHVNFDELPKMASDQNSSDPAPECQTMASDQNSSDPVPECQTMASDQHSFDPAPKCQTMALEHDSLSLGRKCQENVSHRDKTVTTLNELDLLFSPMFDELLNGHSQVVSKSFAVSAADAPNQRQQYTTSLNNHTTPAPTCQIPTIAPTVISSENINQAEPHAENNEVADDEFINIFSTPVQDQGETSSRHVDSSNMHTFYQRYPSKHR